MGELFRFLLFENAKRRYCCRTTCSSTTTPFHLPSPSAPSSSPSLWLHRQFSIINAPRKLSAHPYTIKATSTVLLSRSTSSNAQGAIAVRRYVPLSASPSSPSPSSLEDDDGESEYWVHHHKHTGTRRNSRPSRHRYSRSLTGSPEYHDEASFSWVA